MFIHVLFVINGHVGRCALMLLLLSSVILGSKGFCFRQKTEEMTKMTIEVKISIFDEI